MFCLGLLSSEENESHEQSNLSPWDYRLALIRTTDLAVGSIKAHWINFFLKQDYIDREKLSNSCPVPICPLSDELGVQGEEKTMTGIICLFLESNNSVIALYPIVIFLTLYFEMQYKTGKEPIWTRLTRSGLKNKLGGNRI